MSLCLLMSFTFSQILFAIELLIPLALCIILAQVRKTKPPTVMKPSKLFRKLSQKLKTLSLNTSYTEITQLNVLFQVIIMLQDCHLPDSFLLSKGFLQQGVGIMKGMMQSTIRCPPGSQNYHRLRSHFVKQQVECTTFIIIFNS